MSQQQLLSDAFPYANGDLHTANANWVYSVGSFQISANKCYASANPCQAYRSDVVWPNDQYSRVTLSLTVSGGTQNCGPAVRVAAGADTGYVVQCGTDLLQLSRRVAGVGSVLVTQSLVLPTGTVVELAVQGQHLTVTVNGQVTIQTSDNAISSGNAGIFGAANLLDNGFTAWDAGSFSGLATNGIWNKLGTVTYQPSDDASVTTFGGTSNGDLLYDINPQIISANPDGKVFKMWFMVKADLWYAEANQAQGPWTRGGAALITSFGLSKIYKSGSTYYLYGCSPPSGTPTAIACYTSSNGTTFTLQTATALSIGGVGAWDHNSVQYMKPFYFDGTTYYATYSATPDGGFGVGVGIATSTNLINWTNAANAAVHGIGGPCPIQTGGKFYILTSVEPNPGVVAPSCGMVSSVDRVTWTPPVQLFQPTQVNEGSQAPSSEGIGVPVPLEVNGVSYVFYSGTKTTNGTLYREMCATTNVPLAVSLATVATPPNTGVVPYTVAAAPIAADTFQRANETPLSDGGAWILPASPYVQANLVSHLAVSTNVSFQSSMLWSGPPSIGNNQYSEVTVGTASASVSISTAASIRQANATSYVFAVGAGGAWNISAVYAGTTGENLQTGGGSFPIGTLIRLVASGSTLAAYVNGVLFATAGDSTIQSGSPAFEVYDGTTIGATGISVWGGGSASVTPNFPPAGGGGDLGPGYDFQYRM